jgi:MFS family permease
MNTQKQLNPLPAILAAIFTGGLGFGIVLPVSSVILERLEVSTPLIGLTATVMFAGIAIGGPLSGRLIELFGIKRTLTGGLFCNAVLMVCLGLYISLPFWFTIRFIMGIAFASVFTSCETLINRVSNDQNRGRNLGLYAFAFSLSLILGPAGIWLLKFGTLTPFAITGIISFSAALISYFMLPSLTEKSPKIKFDLAFIKRIKVSVIAMLTAGFMEGALIALIPIYAIRQGFSAAETGMLLFAFVLGHGCFPPIIGALGDRIGLKNVLAISYLLGTISFITILFFPEKIPLTGLLILGGASVGALYPLAVGILADYLSSEELPRGNAMTTFCYGLGSIIGPFIPAVIMHITVPKSLFIVSALLYAGLFGMLLLQRKNNS